MNNAGYVALSRQMALFRQMAVSSNNMANINTPAYKNQQMMFHQHLTKTLSHDTTMPQHVSFVKDQGIMRDTADGPLEQTDNPLDVALNGKGFFVVDTPDGPRYTRNGHLQLDDNGMLVTSEGYAIMQQGDLPFFFAPNETEVLINRDGSIATENGIIGRMRVVSFENEQMLRQAGGTMLDSSVPPQEVDAPQVVQGMVEGSNVQGVVEMTNLIETMRNFEMTQRMIESEGERQQRTIQTLGQLGRT